jgi:hypothetical protein
VARWRSVLGAPPLRPCSAWGQGWRVPHRFSGGGVESARLHGPPVGNRCHTTSPVGNRCHTAGGPPLRPCLAWGQGWLSSGGRTNLARDFSPWLGRPLISFSSRQGRRATRRSSALPGGKEGRGPRAPGAEVPGNERSPSGRGTRSHPNRPCARAFPDAQHVRCGGAPALLSRRLQPARLFPHGRGSDRCTAHRAVAHAPWASACAAVPV